VAHSPEDVVYLYERSKNLREHSRVLREHCRALREACGAVREQSRVIRAFADQLVMACAQTREDTLAGCV
jgi:hypothetical protein